MSSCLYRSPFILLSQFQISVQLIFSATHKIIMVIMHKEKDLMWPHLWALLLYHSRSPQSRRENNSLIFRYCNTPASYSCQQLRNSAQAERTIQKGGWNCLCGRGKTSMHKIILNKREVCEWEWNLKWSFTASFHSKGMSHCIEKHCRHSLVCVSCF